VALTGGQKLAARLAQVAAKVHQPQTVQVGFLEGSTYPDGQSLPMVAAIMEYGGEIHVAAHTAKIYRKLDKDGGFAKGGRFVKKKQADIEQDVEVPAHTITIPPRPFFRRMIAQNQAGWQPQVATLLKQNDYDVDKSLNQMGMVIADQLRQSIVDFRDPPLAPSTVKAKGSDKPLVDTGHMLNSVDYEVK
jgi:hypothetical protein